MRPRGFGPPTARFVAEYSIQLGYECIGEFILLLILIPPLRPCQVRDGASGGIRTSDRLARSRVLYPAELRMHRETYFTTDFLIPPLKPYQVGDDASGKIRTSGRSVCSRVLYPAKLRMRMAVRRGFEPRMQLLIAYSLSRGAPSASQSPHHTSLTSASKNLFTAHRYCVAYILLSEAYKSNDFSHTSIVCILHA